MFYTQVLYRDRRVSVVRSPYSLKRHRVWRIVHQQLWRVTRRKKQIRLLCGSHLNIVGRLRQIGTGCAYPGSDREGCSPSDLLRPKSPHRFDARKRDHPVLRDSRSPVRSDRGRSLNPKGGTQRIASRKIRAQRLLSRDQLRAAAWHSSGVNSERSPSVA